MTTAATLDKSAPLPLYHQLKTILLEQIETGAWKAGDRLPAEAELAAQFDVSKITVRQALRDLAELGRVRREQGRGTFVQNPRLQQGPRELTSFTEEMRRHGLAPGSRILEHAVMEADGPIARALGVSEHSKVLFLRRLRLAGAEPMGIQSTAVPLDLAPSLPQQDLGGGSLYEVLQREYGLHAATARETHFAVLLFGEEARLLDVPDGSPGLAAERVAFLAGGRPLEFTTSLMRGDRYRIRLELSAEWHSRAALRAGRLDPR